jgi:hypothetical protein
MLVNFYAIKRIIVPDEYGEEYTTGASVTPNSFEDGSTGRVHRAVRARPSG